jgi:hypothetical protein
MGWGGGGFYVLRSSACTGDDGALYRECREGGSADDEAMGSGPRATCYQAEPMAKGGLVGSGPRAPDACGFSDF